VHVDLHLRGVLGLGERDALGDQLGEALRRMGLELDDVPGLRRFEQTEGDTVERAAEMPAMGLDAELPPGLGIDLQHRRAGGAQVADEPGLFQLAGLEQAQDAARVPRGRRPAEIIPERAGAGLADQRGAEVVAEAVALPGLVGGVDRGEGRRRGFGKLGHQHASSRSSAPAPPPAPRSRRRCHGVRAGRR
jgi:hypothetical protein